MSTVLAELIRNLCTIAHLIHHEDLNEFVGSNILCNALLLSHTRKRFIPSNYKIHSALLLLILHLVRLNLLYNLNIAAFLYFHANHDKHACFTQDIFHICLVLLYLCAYTFHIMKILFYFYLPIFGFSIL